MKSPYRMIIAMLVIITLCGVIRWQFDLSIEQQRDLIVAGAVAAAFAYIINWRTSK